MNKQNRDMRLLIATRKEMDQMRSDFYAHSHNGFVTKKRYDQLCGAVLALAILVLLLAATGCATFCPKPALTTGVVFVNAAEARPGDKPGEWIVSDGWMTEQVEARQQMEDDNEQLLDLIDRNCTCTNMPEINGTDEVVE